VLEFEANTLARLRAELPTIHHATYLNSGTAGPMPKGALRAAQEESELETLEGRGNFATFTRHLCRLERVRALIARIIGGDDAEIALMHHTSDAVNTVLWGLKWKPGDRVVTTTLEHDAVTVPLGVLRERFGARIEFVDIGLGEKAVPALREALAKPARLCIISHVAYSTGARLPLAELAQMAHQQGTLLLVDGAQAAGALPVDVHASDVDFYTVSGQKWLLGPEGTGALYVRRSLWETLQPTFASYFSAKRHDFRGNNELHDDARRFEVAMLHRPSIAAFEASLQFVADEVGVERAFARARALANEARHRIGAQAGVWILSPASCPSHLLAFSLEGWSHDALHAASLELARRGIVLRSIDHAPFALRASFGFFNDERDIDAFCGAVAELVASGPPPRRS
jgi:L-cysteine/cystine lyase